MKSLNAVFDHLEQASDVSLKFAVMDAAEITSDKEGFKRACISIHVSVEAAKALLRQDTTETISHDENSDLYEAEVKKVTRKLKLWSNRPDQINALILISYLKLKYEDEVSQISVEKLKKRYLTERYGTYNQENAAAYSRKFVTNFDQMKTFAERNHGKVFALDVEGNVMIWSRVQSVVDMFRRDMKIGIEQQSTVEKGEGR